MNHLYSIKTRKTFVGYEKPSLDDFYHHGILGMKWGKQNGPPYPLGAGDHSASEKKAGYKKSIGGGRNEELYDRKKKPSTTIQTARKKDQHERAADASARDTEDLRRQHTIKEFGDYDDEDQALDALAKKYGFKNRDELDSHYLTRTDRQEAKKDPKAYKEWEKDQEMSDAYDDISDFYYNKRNKVDDSSKSNPLMNKAADLFVKRALGFGSLEKYDSDREEISDYRQKKEKNTNIF